MAQISLTIHSPEIKALQPLIHVEEYLEELLDFSDYADFKMRKCVKAMERLRNFHLEGYTLRQHRRVLELLAIISKLGEEIPKSDELYKPFRSLRKQARIQFNQYKRDGGFRSGEELWKDVCRYKMTLAQMPLRLCYLATEEVLESMRPILMTLKQHQMYEYCRTLRTVEEFVRATNIRHLVAFELRYAILINKSVQANIFTEAENKDVYIENIFKEFIQLPEAFCWTLLQNLDLGQQFQHQNMVYICMGHTMPPERINAVEWNEQQSDPPPFPASGHTIEPPLGHATIQFDAHAQALATLIYQRYIDYINQIKPVSFEDEDVKLPTLEHFMESLHINPASASNSSATSTTTESQSNEAIVANVKIVGMKPSTSARKGAQKPNHVAVDRKSGGLIMNRNLLPKLTNGTAPNPGRIYYTPDRGIRPPVQPPAAAAAAAASTAAAAPNDESHCVLDDFKQVNGGKCDFKIGSHANHERNSNRPRGRKNRRHHRK